ncbi:MAG: hypothetical protein CSA62_13090 [Planctomycetota bacterium]|nr:MAG: hypothetical protein CSA62_13090 [Planctomycetota bacterium]
MKQHWTILIWMLAGVILGGILQFTLEAKPKSGLEINEIQGQPVITGKSGLAKRSKLAKGDRLLAVTLHKGQKRSEERLETATTAAFQAAIAKTTVGDVVWVEVQRAGAQHLHSLSIDMREDSPRRSWVAVGVKVVVA